MRCGECDNVPSPPPGAERATVRWGLPPLTLVLTQGGPWRNSAADACPTPHLTLTSSPPGAERRIGDGAFRNNSATYSWQMRVAALWTLR